MGSIEGTLGCCAGCGGRLVHSGDKVTGQIVVCQRCGKWPDAWPARPGEKVHHAKDPDNELRRTFRI